MKVYDGFLFFNELELLDLRLNVLNEVVDWFVLVEATTTYTGVSKPLHYIENKKLFEKFNHKIIHIVVDTLPVYEQFKIARKVEEYQRNKIKDGFQSCNDEDLVMFSDVDEIPRPELLVELKQHITDEDVLGLFQKLYYYYFNVFKEDNWVGPRLGRWKKIKTLELEEIRLLKHITNYIPNGGWHFSYMGGLEKIKTKIESFSHTECNTELIKNSIAENINLNNDLYNRGKLQVVPLDESYPKYITNNIQKFKHMIKW